MFTTQNTLTRREFEILELMTEGYSNVKIAQILKISANTVKSHCKIIFEKLGVDNRTAATKKAILEGILWI